MDIHPPRHAIHTGKDFLLHLLTITVGLFIALSLEAAVEPLQHRHLMRDARDNGAVSCMEPDVIFSTLQSTMKGLEDVHMEQSQKRR